MCNQGHRFIQLCNKNTQFRSPNPSVSYSYKHRSCDLVSQRYNNNKVEKIVTQIQNFLLLFLGFISHVSYCNETLFIKGIFLVFQFVVLGCYSWSSFVIFLVVLKLRLSKEISCSLFCQDSSGTFFCFHVAWFLALSTNNFVFSSFDRLFWQSCASLIFYSQETTTSFVLSQSIAMWR